MRWRYSEVMRGASGPLLLLVTALFLTLQGCGGDEAELELELAEQNRSGQSGSATLTPADGGGTTIVIDLASPPAEPQPAHVHDGTCDDIGDVVAPLESIAEGASETTVPLSLDELRLGGLIVHAHKSDAEFDVSVACAPIPEH
jgi:hypothetical protein